MPSGASQVPVNLMPCVLSTADRPNALIKSFGSRPKPLRFNELVLGLKRATPKDERPPGRGRRAAGKLGPPRHRSRRGRAA